MTVQTVDLHWAAGFLDGEGSFAASKGGVLQVSAAQQYAPSLEKLKKIFSHGDVLWQRKNNPKLKGFWRWEISGRRAAAIMMTLYPLMSTYRQGQIEEALRKWKQQPGRWGKPSTQRYMHKGKEVWPCN
jgi:hypothetical protein